MFSLKGWLMESKIPQIMARSVSQSNCRPQTRKEGDNAAAFCSTAGLSSCKECVKSYTVIAKANEEFGVQPVVLL